MQQQTARRPIRTDRRHLRSHRLPVVLGAVVLLLAGLLDAAVAAAPASSETAPVAAVAAAPVGADLCATVGYDAGFRGDALVIAVAIALVESACNPAARGVNGPTLNCPLGSVDRGLWQINSCYGADVSDACAYDAACNARAAYRLSASGTKWTPWSAYSSGRYLTRMDAARAAVDRLLRRPYGFLDSIDPSVRGVVVRGWALDPDTADPITVQIKVDDAATASATADRSRPDVGAANPGAGNSHGFQALVPIASGTHTVCAYGVNVGAEALNSLLGCQVVTPSGVPWGVYGAREAPGGVRFDGWAVDPDTASPIDVHAYVDAVAVGASASRNRPDIAAAYPLAGPNHGFDSLVVPAGHGTHTACAYAINQPTSPGVNALLHPGCTTLNLTGVPYGAYTATRSFSTVRVEGWAIDPDLATPVTVHVYVDTGRAAVPATAGGNRPDVAAAFPGYDVTIGPLSLGQHRVCAYAINNEPNGLNPVLHPGCITVTI